MKIHCKCAIFTVFLTFMVIISVKMVFANDSNYNLYNPNEYSSGKIQNLKEKILFIVDFSNSMNENLVNGRKIDIAVKSLNNLLPTLNPKIETGLRVYGHKNGFTPNQSCTASALVAPLQANNSFNIQNKLSMLNAKGWTPITYSLKKAVNSDFLGIMGPKRIVLLSDGGENCDESPCDYAIELMRFRDDIRIDVIAFDIDDASANDQLKCVALTTSGKFYTANTAAELSKSLRDSMNMEKEVEGVLIKK